MAYHIEYEKVKSYEMQDYNFASVDEWYDHVLDEYDRLRMKTGTTRKRIQPASMSQNHKNLLKDALEHRFDNKNKNVGWMCFKDIMGEYLITIDDLAVVEKRVAKLTEFIEIINSDEKMISNDPNPSGRALGEVEVIQDTERSLEEVTRIALLMSANTQKDKMSAGGVMGYIANNYPQFKSQLKDIAPKVSEGIKDMRKLMREKGEGEITQLIELEFPELLKEEKKEETPEFTGKIVYYFPPGIYNPKKVFYEMGEKEKEIDIAQLIRKMGHDKDAKEKLNRIKPGGPDWPSSAAGNYYIVISNDPMLMVTKSTGRTWASTSCENYRGAHPQGPFSDVKWGNCIVYIFKDDKPDKGWPIIYTSKLKGRTLLRWGLKDNNPGSWGVGVERRVYPSNKTWGLPVATAVGMILNDRGLMDYKKCTTPYNYKGWSDTMRGANVKIVYQGFTMEGQNIDIQQMVFAPELNIAGSPTISYADLHRLSRASMDIRIKRVLGQNPSIWQFPEVVGRLIRTGDYEVINQLIHHSIAHPGALNSIAEALPELFPNDWTNPNGSLWKAIISHHNTHPRTHQWMIDNHPGFGDIPFIQRAYLDESIFPVCYAPPEIIDVLLDYYNPSIAGGESGDPSPIVGFHNLIFAPHISETQYLKLLDIIDKKGVGHRNLYSDLKYSLILPLTQENNWVYTGKGLESYFNAGQIYNNYNISFLQTLSPQWRSLYLLDRQNPKIIKKTLPILETLLGAKESEGLKILLENVRSREVWNLLWRERDSYDIPSMRFTMLSRSSKDFSKPANNNLLRQAIFNNAFEETEGGDLSALRYDFDYDNPDKRRLRMEVSPKTLDDLLEEPERIDLIGYDVVALWLTSPTKHFEIFENLVLSKALGNLWQEGELLPPPENPFDLYSEIENIDILQRAAVGEGAVFDERERGKTGLVCNDNLPVRLQYSLLDKWLRISTEYNGSYGEFLYLVEKGLAQNHNTSSELITRLMNYEHLHEFIANNPNTPVSRLTGVRGGGRENSLYYKYPVEVLKNNGLPLKAFETLWDATIKFLRTEVDEDTDRLFRLFLERKDLLLGSKGKKNRNNLRDILKGYENWIRYWRGGSTKKGVFKPFENLNLFKGEGGISDWPIPITGKKSVIFKFYDKREFTNLNELYFVEETEPLEGHRIHIKGQKYSFDEEVNQFTEKAIDEIFSAEDFYEYIPPDERGGPVQKYICESCMEADVKNPVYRLSEEELMIHHQNTHGEDVEFRYIMGERDPEKWRIPNLFVFTDVDPPQGKKKVPEWRYSWSTDEMNEILKRYLVLMDGSRLLRGWNYNPFRIDAPQTPADKVARISDVLVFNTIDSLNLWNKKLVNDNLDLIFAGAGGLFESFNNLPLTEKLLDLSLSVDDKELAQYGLSREMLPLIHRKILTYPNLPPSYLFALYNVSIDEITLNMIKDLRMQMPYEFNQYILDNTETHPEEVE